MYPTNHASACLSVVRSCRRPAGRRTRACRCRSGCCPRGSASPSRRLRPGSHVSVSDGPSRPSYPPCRSGARPCGSPSAPSRRRPRRASRRPRPCRAARRRSSRGPSPARTALHLQRRAHAEPARHLADLVRPDIERQLGVDGVVRAQGRARDRRPAGVRRVVRLHAPPRAVVAVAVRDRLVRERGRDVVARVRVDPLVDRRREHEALNVEPGWRRACESRLN